MTNGTVNSSTETGAARAGAGAMHATTELGAAYTAGADAVYSTTSARTPSARRTHSRNIEKPA